MDRFFIVIGILIAAFVLWTLVRGFFLTKSDQKRWNDALEAAETMRPMREVSYNESLYGNDPMVTRGTWVEDELSDCKYGCKIYKNSETGERAIAHNSSYGCYK